MKKRQIITGSRGQSLVEVVVATGVIILLATGLIAGTTAALKANLSARARSEATKMVQEGLEAARHKRDVGWYDFKALAPGNNTPYYYCVDDTASGTEFNATASNKNPGAVGNESVCAGNVQVDVGSGNISYRRYASFTWELANSRMLVVVTARWNESGVERTSQASTFLTRWR